VSLSITASFSGVTFQKSSTWQMRLSLANCGKVVLACDQSVAMFGAEVWWKGDQIRGTIGQANGLQLLVNREARAITGYFRTTNLGALMESGLRPATTQLENRQRSFGLRLLSMPQGSRLRKSWVLHRVLANDWCVLLILR